MTDVCAEGDTPSPLSTQLLQPQVLDCVLNHPSIAQHQQTVCVLLSTSKDVREAVAARLRGQLAVQLTVAGRQKQKVLQLAEWLTTHAPLVQRLVLQLSDVERRCSPPRAPLKYDLLERELEGVAASLQQAAGTGLLFLQHFCIQGTPINLGLLTALPVSCLTSLDCEVRGGDCEQDFQTTRSWLDTIRCISQLSQLRQLNFSKAGPLGATKGVLQRLTRLQQLTKLQIGEADINQLQQLPHNLQQVEVAVQVQATSDLVKLASWIQQHAGILTSLEILRTGQVPIPIEHNNEEGLIAALERATAGAASG